MIRARSCTSSSGFAAHRAVQFVLQPIFVGEAIEALRCWVLRGRKHGQHCFSFAVGAFTAGSAQQNPFVITQDLRAMDPTWAQKR